MRLDRDLAHAKIGTDLFVQPAAGYQGHDLPFATRERLESRAQFAVARLRAIPVDDQASGHRTAMGAEERAEMSIGT
ncbi:MAG TPA: hypothetical protein VKB34_18875 [Povalibacter sp.]|nr:hypothetical protein [Povalibacter sp.]